MYHRYLSSLLQFYVRYPW